MPGPRPGQGGRPRLPRCPDHGSADARTCYRCDACRALRGQPSFVPTSGTSGHQRGHPERRKPT